MPNRINQLRFSGDLRFPPPGWGPAALVALLLCAPVLGLPEDALQPLSIDADNATYDDDPNGALELTGNVTVRQGTLHVTAERVEATKRDGKLNRVVATGAEGEPARFRQQIQPDEPPAHARAQKVDYSIAEQKAKLTGDAFLSAGERTYSGGTIIWDMKDNRVVCEDGCQMTGIPPSPD